MAILGPTEFLDDGQDREEVTSDMSDGQTFMDRRQFLRVSGTIGGLLTLYSVATTASRVYASFSPNQEPIIPEGLNVISHAESGLALVLAGDFVPNNQIQADMASNRNLILHFVLDGISTDIKNAFGGSENLRSLYGLSIGDIVKLYYQSALLYYQKDYPGYQTLQSSNVEVDLSLGNTIASYSLSSDVALSILKGGNLSRLSENQLLKIVDVFDSSSEDILDIVYNLRELLNFDDYGQGALLNIGQYLIDQKAYLPSMEFQGSTDPRSFITQRFADIVATLNENKTSTEANLDAPFSVEIINSFVKTLSGTENIAQVLSLFSAYISERIDYASYFNLPLLNEGESLEAYYTRIDLGAVMDLAYGSTQEDAFSRGAMICGNFARYMADFAQMLGVNSSAVQVYYPGIEIQHALTTVEIGGVLYMADPTRGVGLMPFKQFTSTYGYQYGLGIYRPQLFDSLPGENRIPMSLIYAEMVNPQNELFAEINQIN